MRVRVDSNDIKLQFETFVNRASHRRGNQPTVRDRSLSELQ